MSTGARQNWTFARGDHEAEIDTFSTAKATLDAEEDPQICASGDDESNSKDLPQPSMYYSYVITIVISD
jgi:hypothetical protein